jgi:hypothetical protein
MFARAGASRECRRGLSDRKYRYFAVNTRSGELSSTNVVPVAASPQNSLEVDVSRGSSLWLRPTAHALDRVVRLPKNWDSNGALPIQRKAVENALRWLDRLLDEETFPPAIVPTVVGGVQAEWHMAGLDIEIDFGPDGNSYVALDDQIDGTSWEGELRANTELLLRAIPRLRDE